MLMQNSVDSLVMSIIVSLRLSLSNAVVVETSDAVLVADKNAIQDVKKIVTALQLSHRSEGSRISSVSTIEAMKPFAKVTISSQKNCCALGKSFRCRCTITGRSIGGGFWSAQVTCGDEVFTLIENQSTYIPLGQKHRLENIGSIPLTLIEIQSGAYLGEDDIVRFDDDYVMNNRWLS